MDTPSDSEFDDYYDEVAQDLFSEEMESMKKLEQERAIEKNGEAKEEDEETEDQEDKNIDVQKDEEDEDEEEGEEEEEEGEEEEEEEEREEREEPGSERKEEKLSKVDDFILDTAIVAAAQGTNGRLGYWSLSELSDKDFEKGEICADRCCRINKPKVGQAPQRMKTLRWKHDFFLAQKGSESMPTLRVCFYNEKEENKFWGIPDIMSHVASTGKSAWKQLENAKSLAADWMKAEDFDSSAWRLTLTAEAKDENIECNAGESDVDASNPTQQKKAPRLRRNTQRRLKREKCEPGLRGLRGETGERGERGEKGKRGEAGPPGRPGQSGSKMWANALERQNERYDTIASLANTKAAELFLAHSSVALGLEVPHNESKTQLELTWLTEENSVDPPRDCASLIAKLVDAVKAVV
eukprot:g31443.t1